MTVTQKVERKLGKFAEGSTFSYRDLAIAPQEYYAAAKAMERIINKGMVKRVSTGVFYKPRQTPFGELKPRETELLKPYLFQNGKRIAYITGLSLYNRLGLTTQVPKTIRMASRDKKAAVTIGNISARYVKSYVDVSESNYQVLELLDVIKDFKQIPDMDKKEGITRLKDLISRLDKKQMDLMIKCSLKYPPRVRALFGALLEYMQQGIDNNKLRQSLSPLSQYDYKLPSSVLPTATNWNIV